jgi:FKBP-type peptidyl-prolyl cis-trans isomerase SlyD
MKVGDVKSVTVSPQDGYGEIDPDAFELMPYDVFPGDLELEEGMEMRLVDNATGQEVQAYIAELREEGAVLDLNHPLAGETLFFEIEVVDLRAATPEELAHGHAHTH